MCRKRNRTSTEDIGHGLYLYFLGLSFRNVAKALSFLHIAKRSHVAAWTGFKITSLRRCRQRERGVSQFIIDETHIKVGSELLWLWIAIEPKTHAILRTKISKERNMFVAERFLLDTVEE